MPPIEIVSHIVHGATQPRISVMDTPGAGGATHFYRINGLDLRARPEGFQVPIDCGRGDALDIVFQCGPVQDGKFNGLTIESLLAIAIHRLDGFIAGPYGNIPTNVAAREHVAAALEQLHARTRERLDRGVEGKLVK